MGSEWKLVKLGEVLGQKGYIRGPFGSALKRGELQSSGIPVYEQQHAIYGTRAFRFFIDQNKYRELSRFTVQPNDLIISCSGTLGRVSVIRETDPIGIISQALLILRPDTHAINPRFLYQILSSPAGFHSLVSVSTGSVQVNIAKRSIIENINILLPPLSEQKAIAHILGALDDKIELNQKMNETLEAMAQALFKSWFVDFDFVKPEDKCESEIGLIPKGWDIQRISKFMILSYGKSLPEKNRNNGSVPVYGSGGITGFHDQELIAEKTIIVGRKGTVGSLYWESRPCFPIDTVFYVKPIFPLSFCYYLLKSLPLRSMNTDAAVPGLNRENVYRLEFPLPPSKLVSLFAKNSDRLRNRMDTNFREIENLVSLRDLLLPKLISGKLRIKDAEKFLESHI